MRYNIPQNKLGVIGFVGSVDVQSLSPNVSQMKTYFNLSQNENLPQSTSLSNLPHSTSLSNLPHRRPVELFQIDGIFVEHVVERLRMPFNVRSALAFRFTTTSLRWSRSLTRCAELARPLVICKVVLTRKRSRASCTCPLSTVLCPHVSQ